MPFNPDEYISKKGFGTNKSKQSSFDPDAYITKKGFGAMATDKQPIQQEPLKPIYDQLDVKQNPVLGTVQDVAGQFGSALINQLGYNLPKQALKAAGRSFPEPVTPAGKVAEAVGGVTGAIASPFNKIAASKMGLKGISLGSKIVRSGIQGAMYTPETKEGKLSEIINPAQRLAQGALGAGVVGGGALIAKGAKPAAEFLARNVGKISKTGLETIKRVGYDKVKTVMEKGNTYLGNTVIPKVRTKVVDSITKFNEKSKPLLEEFGFTPDDLSELGNVSKDRLKEFSKLASNNWYKMTEKIETARQSVGKAIGDVYKRAAKEGKKVSIDKTLDSMKNALESKGLVDMKGNLTSELENITSPTLKTLAKTYAQFKPYANTKLNIPSYRNMITELESALGVDEKFNSAVYPVIRAARNEGIGSIRLGLKELNRKYSDYITLSGLSKKLNTAVNEGSDKFEGLYNKIRNTLNANTRKKYADILGKEIIDDIDSLSIARELNPETTEGLLRGVTREATKGVLNIGSKINKAGKTIGRKLNKPFNPIKGLDKLKK